MTDDFDVLGVGPDATEAEITSAYRRRARAVHPDLRLVTGARDRPAPSEEFLLLTEARRRAMARATATRLGRGAIPGQRRPATGRTPTRDDDPMLALLTLPQRCPGSWSTEALEVWALTVVPAARAQLADARQAADVAGAGTTRHRHWATVHALITLTLATASTGRRRAALAGLLPSAYAAVEQELPATLVERLPARVALAAPRRRTTLAAGATGALLGGLAVWAELPGRLLG